MGKKPFRTGYLQTDAFIAPLAVGPTRATEWYQSFHLDAALARHRGHRRNTLNPRQASMNISGKIGEEPELDAIVEILTNIKALHPGPLRLALVQQLSKSRFLTLIDDCKNQLAELGLVATYHPETDPE